MRWTKDHNCRRERSRIGAASEFQSSPDEGNITTHTVIVPPCSVRPCREQTDDRCPLQGSFIGFPDPFANFAAIGRIHPADPVPFLGKPIVFTGEICFTFRILSGCTYIKGEMIRGVQLFEELNGCFPFTVLR